MWDHLFSSANDIGVKATYKKGMIGTGGVPKLNAEWGVCAAMSALWIKKMFTTRDILANPDKNAASFLYAKWANRQDGQGLSSDAFNRGLIENAGLTVQSMQPLGAAQAVLTMSATGSYYISTGNHAMAAATSQSGFYFFDPNGGAWKSLSPGDFSGIQPVIEGYAPLAGYNPNWLIYKVLNG